MIRYQISKFLFIKWLREKYFFLFDLIKYEFFEFLCNKSVTKVKKNQDSSWNIRDKSFSLSLTDFGAKIRLSLGHFSQISLTFLNEILKSFDQNMVLSLLLCIFNDSLEKKIKIDYEKPEEIHFLWVSLSAGAEIS